jgi:hypothetical protein
VAYNLNKFIVGPKLWYSYVEILALATIHAIERLWYYILLQHMIVIANVNPR